MFDSVSREEFGYAFEKIRNAVASGEARDAEFAKDTALEFLKVQYGRFRRELQYAGEYGDHEYDLDTLEHAIAVLQRWFDGNPDGLTERDARIYSEYLQTAHQGFVQLARELATPRR